ncbi:hypothetical protein GCM10027360_81860 [Amycolatopsis echigonensis]
MEQDAGFGEPALVFFERDRVCGEFLAERHRHGVLELSAADLEHVGEFDGFCGEVRAERADLVVQFGDASVERELDRGRIDVVGALPEVDVVEGGWTFL